MIVALGGWMLHSTSPATRQASGDGGELVVFAAASLKESFEAIAKSFEAANPGVHVSLQFAGSQALALQIKQGATADVFASADEPHLREIAYDPTSRRLFALNRLVVITPASGAKFKDFQSLNRAKEVVLAAKSVPAGAYARQALDAAASKFGRPWELSVLSHVVSEEADVRAVLTKVELGEADAGIVYYSDAVAGGKKVKITPIPSACQPNIQYPMAIVANSKQAHVAMHFMHEVLSNEGQAVFARHGFISPMTRAENVIVIGPSGQQIYPMPFPKRWPRETVKTKGPGDEMRTYTGVPISKLFPGKPPTDVTFVGADEYSATFKYAALLKSHAVVVPFRDKYAEVIVPGEKPRVWISWLTRIVGK